MKYLACATYCVILGLLNLAGSSVRAQEAPLAWYDPEHQAVAVNPYADGYGGTIYIDFDGDHTWAGVIDQSGWLYLYGDVTEPGLSYSTTDCAPDGSCNTEILYGWGDHLGSLHAIPNFNAYVASLSDGREAINKLHYYAAPWDVAAGATTILVRPMDSSNNSLPVLPGDAGHIYINVVGPDGFEWRTLADLDPSHANRIEATVCITPETFNLKSNGRWISIRIVMPEGYTAQSVDFTSLAIASQIDSVDVMGILYKSARRTVGSRFIFRDHTRSAQGEDHDAVEMDFRPTNHTSKSLIMSRDQRRPGQDNGDSGHRSICGALGSRAGSRDQTLSLKIDRQSIGAIVQPGEMQLTVSGKLLDGTFFEGADTIHVLD